MPLPTNRVDGDPIPASDHNDTAAAVNSRGLNVQTDPYDCTGEDTQLDAAGRINDAIADANEVGDTSRNSVAGGYQVIAPPGIYTAGEPVLGRGGVILEGAGPHQTVLSRKAETDTEMFNLATLEENSWGIHSLKFDGNRNNQSVEAIAMRLERSATIADDIPGYLAGPEVAEMTSPVFGGGDFITLNDLVFSAILGIAIETMGQNAQLIFDHIFVWWVSSHGIYDGGVDSEWGFVQVGNCGKTCMTIAGANGRYSHLKLYESDCDDEGWPALDIPGVKNTVALAEIQEATYSGIRIAGSDNTVEVRVDGASEDAVIINGHHNSVEANVRQFSQYRPKYAFAFGVGARGNVLTINHRDYSVATGRGDLRGNTVKVSQGVLS